MEDKLVPAGGSAAFDTGVHIQLEPIVLGNGMYSTEFITVGVLQSKSGLNFKHGITGEGVIDIGYTGSIRVKLYNQGPVDYWVRRGDKISQLVIYPALTPKLEIVEELSDTERGEGGFGSTGR
jgi:dUTP pyrophosphatase